MIIEVGSINKIQIHNAEGLCSNRHCSKKEEYYLVLEIGETEYFLTLCSEHMKIIGKERV